MGTNYTALTGPNSKFKGEDLHIGKSSMGWVFSLRVHPALGINTLYDWIPVLLDPETRIIDEYHRSITFEYMMQRITCRARRTDAEPLNMSEAELKENHAVQGPNGLLRAAVTETWQQVERRHGEGTWDYCNYEFS